MFMADVVRKTLNAVRGCKLVHFRHDTEDVDVLMPNAVRRM